MNIMLEVYDLKITEYYADGNHEPDVHVDDNGYHTKNEAAEAAWNYLDVQAERFNAFGGAEGQFIVNDSPENDHVGQLEFWEGKETKNNRDFRLVATIDIIPRTVGGNGI